MSGWLKKVARIFLGSKEGDDLAKKSAATGAGVGTYWYAEYLLLGLTASLVAFLRYLGLTAFQIFLIFWPANIVLGWLIVKVHDASGVDFTMFAGYSRLFSSCSIKKKFWRIACYIGLSPIALIIIIVAIIWQGAGPIIIFLRERRAYSKFAIALLLITISGIQMGIWTRLYILGLDNIYDLIKYYLWK